MVVHIVNKIVSQCCYVILQSLQFHFTESLFSVIVWGAVSVRGPSFGPVVAKVAVAIHTNAGLSRKDVSMNRKVNLTNRIFLH